MPHPRLHGECSPDTSVPYAFRRAPAGAWAQALLQLLVRPTGAPGVSIVTTPAGPASAPGDRPPGRADAALTLQYTRGDRALAIRIAQNRDLTTAALQRLRARTRTVEGAKVLTSQEGTWALLARTAGFQDPWQLHPLLLETVAAILRDAGYRSVHLYIGAAKRKHVLSGHPWTDLLDRSAKEVFRSCLRGLGPPKRAEPFPLHDLGNLPTLQAPLATGGPIFPQRALLTGAWWLLREIELANILVNHVTILDENKGVAILLPASKSDPTAQGVVRNHMCVCGAHSHRRLRAPALCPARAVLNQLESLAGIFPAE